MKTLILNSNNVVAGTNNSVFQYNFPQGGYTFKEDLIAVQEISMFFSAFNVSAFYNNTTYSYIWVDGTVNSVVMPDSFLQISDINAFLQSVMVGNGHYLIDGDGNFVYLLEMVVNQAKYAVQINNYVISSALATTYGWTLPAGATWVLPTATILPYLVVPSNNNFGLLIGFEAGQYPTGVIAGTPPAQTQTPSYSGATSELSSKAPQITPYSSFLVFCSLVNNRAVIPSQLCFSFTPQNSVFGALQTFQPNAEMGWNKIENGSYTAFRIEIRDQFGNPVSFQDPNTLITLYTKNKDEWNIK